MLKNTAVSSIILSFLAAFLFVFSVSGEESFFSIALSKFSTKQEAAREEKKLKNSGHNAFFRKEKDPQEGEIYQVYIEKYDSLDEAKMEARVLKELDLISEYTVKEVMPVAIIPPKKEIATTDENEDLTSEMIEGGMSFRKQQPEDEDKKNEQPETETPPETKKPSEELEKQSPKQEEAASDGGLKNMVRKQISAKNNTPETVTKVEQPQDELNEKAPGETSLQVGAFKEESNARAEKIRLTDLGRNAFYRFESIKNKGDFYRLYITGYSSLRDAVKDAKELVKSGVISGYTRVHDKDLKSSDDNTPDKKIWAINISSNKEEVSAIDEVAELKQKGYDAFYTLEKTPADTWYKVYIKDFKNEEAAREKGVELLHKKVIGYFKPFMISTKNIRGSGK